MNIQKSSEPSRDELALTEIEPFSEQLKPIIEEALNETSKNGRSRKGTLFTPMFTVFVVLGLAMRHELDYHKIVSWLISSIRWLTVSLPKKIIGDGTVTKARQYLGTDVFRIIFEKFIKEHYKSTMDFHGRSSVIFDGVTATVPDTISNQQAFGKPSNKKGSSAFPKVRAVALMSLTLRCILDVAYGPYKGKGTGERTLMYQLLEKFREKGFLFLLDAGLYSFELLEWFEDRPQEFMMRIACTIQIKKIKSLKDGSYIGVIKKKFKNPNSTSKKSLPQTEKEVQVRVISYQIRGFRTMKLITNIFDETVMAKELVKHYHKRWDIELAFDEIKTRQCATLKGQLATVFRSKTAELVEQELYAILITYNCIRQLMCQACEIHNKDPRFISFIEILQLLKDAIPIINIGLQPLRITINYLLQLIAQSSINRPRRPRVNPRVVKVKGSKFKRKNASHSGSRIDFENDLQILQTT